MHRVATRLFNLLCAVIGLFAIIALVAFLVVGVLVPASATDPRFQPSPDSSFGR